VAAASFTIAGLEVRVRPYPETRWRPNVEWLPLGDGSYAGQDRGLAGDVHETDVVIFGTRTEVQTIQESLDAGGIFALSNINGFLFDVLVNHSSSISVQVEMGPTEQKAYVLEEDGYYEYPVTLRAVEYTRVSRVGSLAALTLRHAFENGHTDPSRPRWSYDNVPSLSNGLDDEGNFVHDFYLSNDEAEAVLKYFVAAREAAFLFPALPGITYPFGVTHGAAPYCHARKIEPRRANLHFCFVRVTFTQAYR
jgi:hypothetical protein